MEPMAQGQSLVLTIDVQGVDSFRRAAAVKPLLARRMTTAFIVVDHDRLLARMRPDRARAVGRPAASRAATKRA